MLNYPKWVSACACLLFVITSAKAQQTAQLEVDLSSIKPVVEQVYLARVTDEGEVLDTLKQSNGKYRVTVSVEEPKIGYLLAVPAGGSLQTLKREQTQAVLLEPGTLVVKSAGEAMASIQVSGGKNQNAYQALQAKVKPLEKQMMDLSTAFQAANQKGDAVAVQKIREQFGVLQDEMLQQHTNYLMANPNSGIIGYLLTQVQIESLQEEQVKQLLQAWTPATKALPSVKAFEAEWAVLSRVTIGAVAPDFVQNDPNGTPVNLKQFRGKYVLIDFWASWCGPCRQENPNVVAAYEAFKSKGFTILGVSLDRPNAKEAWLKAIKDDQLAWTQVSDLKFWQNEVAQLYGVKSIPQNFLLDPQGKIIAKNLRGDALKAKLEEVLK